MNKNQTRFGLLNYLPGIFKASLHQKNPLNAILTIAENLFADLNECIDQMDTYFDPLATPATEHRNFLAWLASWVELNLDEDWDEMEKRRIIKDAADLYRYRGTCKGLKYMIELFFDVEAEIEEWRWPGMVIGIRSTIGIDTLISGTSGSNHFFTVRCRCPLANQESKELEQKIRHLIDLEKPAHTVYWLDMQYGDNLLQVRKV